MVIPEIVAANSATTTVVRTGAIIGIFKYIESRIDYAVNNKKSFRDAQAEVHRLVNNAAVVLKRCPGDEGFEGSEFTWLAEIKNLIDDFSSSKIAKEIPPRWALARQKIDCFENNEGFKNGDCEPLAEVETRTNMNRRWGLLRLNAARIGELSMQFFQKAQVLNREYDERISRLNREGALYKKRRDVHLPPQTDMNNLLIKASKMLNECPMEHGGIHDLQFNWFVAVKELIDDIKKSKIATEIPDGWSRVGDNIDKFSANQWYRPEDYARVEPVDINKPLVTGTSDMDLTRFSSRAKELIALDEKNYKDGQRVRPLYKTKPRCTLPPDYEKGRYIAFKSRSGTEDKILRSLKEHSVTLVHGPGGIGKTTILYQVAETAEKDGSFERVVHAKLTRDPGEAHIKDIQLKIAKQLGVPWPPPPTTVLTAHDISAELNKQIAGLGKVLVILDDVWKASDVTTIVGIPIPTTHPAGGEVRVLIGTRMSGLSIRGANKIPLEILSEDDSWSLLQREALVDGTIKHTVAEQIRDECRGLPLALAVIGNALSGKNNAEWEMAANYLKDSEPSKCPHLDGVEDKLYKIIKYSYDHLPDVVNKSVFLCCCLFQESEQVHALDLKTYLAQDEDLVVGVNILANEVLASAQRLEQYGLLKNDIGTRGTVKMHDVVRDVGVYIARKEEYAIISFGAANKKTELGKHCLAKCKRLSLTNIQVAGEMPDCPQLKTLLIRGNTDLPCKYLCKMETSLVVLDLSYSDISTLPDFPDNLQVRTLLLNGCRNLRKVDQVVKLSKLGELSLRKSVVPLLPKHLVLPEVLDWEEDSLPEADKHPAVTPEHVPGELKELSICSRRLTKEAYQKITGFTNLEAVKLYVTYSALSSNDTFDVGKISKWKKFTIYNHGFCPLVSQGKHLSIMELQVVPPGVKELLKTTEEAVISNCFAQVTMSEEITVRGAKTVLVLTEATGQGTFKATKILRLQLCPSISYLTSKDGAAFTELVEMELTNLKQLLGIFKPIESADILETGTFFGKMQKIAVTSCDEMKCVVPNELLQKVHRTLEVVSVKSSNKVEYIFDSEADSPVKLSRMRSIEVDNLEMLKCIWHGIAPQEAFQKLVEFTVRKCNKLTSLFTTHMAAQLKHLQKLTVEDNTGLTQVISTDGTDAEITEQPFPRVTHLSLQQLPILERFSDNDMDFAWPDLVKLKLGACPHLQSLPIAPANAPLLKIIDLAEINDSAWYETLASQAQHLRRFEKWVNNKKHD